MESALNRKNAQELFRAILKLKSVPECQKFFRDLCTLSELEAVTERFQVAKALSKGNASYREISKKTGSSTATITRVAHWLHHGTGGYRLALSRLQD